MSNKLFSVQYTVGTQMRENIGRTGFTGGQWGPMLDGESKGVFRDQRQSFHRKVVRPLMPMTNESTLLTGTVC